MTPDAGSNPTNSAGKADDPGSSAAAAVPGLSHVGEAALDALDAFPGEEGSTWSLRSDSGFDTEWIVQTPNHWGAPVADLSVPTCTTDCDPDFGLQRCQDQSDCTDGGTCTVVQATAARPGDAPASLCVGHSDSIYDEVYLGIIAAERFVDIASLTAMDERFEAAVRNALTYLSYKDARIDVRLLFGNIIGMATDTDAVLDAVTRDLAWGNDLTIRVGGYRKGFTSWNHAKIVAVDGAWLFTGGHNMWSRDYLKRSPVHDISMTVRGGVAEDAHAFANRMWDYTCTDPWFTGWNTRSAYPRWASDCPAPYTTRGATGSDHGVTTFALGRLGAIGPDAADAAMFAALRSAKSTIKLSLQDIGPIVVGGVSITSWPEPVLREIAEAVMRGVDVTIVLSNPGAAPDGKSGLSAGYANGWTATDVARKVSDWLAAHPEAVPAGVNPRAALCDRMHVSHLRINDGDEAWADGTGFGNHAKFFIVDDAAFYLGSQNVYGSDLAEFGLLVDDYDVTADVLADYWDPMWAYSARTAVTGRDAASCAL